MAVRIVKCMPHTSSAICHGALFACVGRWRSCAHLNDGSFECWLQLRIVTHHVFRTCWEGGRCRLSHDRNRWHFVGYCRQSKLSSFSLETDLEAAIRKKLVLVGLKSSRADHGDEIGPRVTLVSVVSLLAPSTWLLPCGTHSSFPFFCVV